jgi:siderophore synthetase component
MKKYKQTAESVSIQSFLNCYLRETQNFFEINHEDVPIDWNYETPEKWIKIPLYHQAIDFLVAVKHWSLTGRHLFHFPSFLKTNEKSVPLDYISLVSLLTKELLLEQNRYDAEDELLLRTIFSCRNIQRYLEERECDQHKLQDSDFTFIEAEQSLLLGHLLHPTPKSKQGMTPEQESLYSPELKGKFQLHFFKVNRSFVKQHSEDHQSAEEISMALLRKDTKFLKDSKELLQDEESVFIPAHPLQVPLLLKDEHIKEIINDGKMSYIGPYGEYFSATSSMRTVYSEGCRYMFKFSVPVKITNSLRVNLEKELYRGIEVSRLMQSNIGKQLQKLYPSFKIIRDPAFLNVSTNKEISGFEVVIRENPFYENEKNVSLIAGLVQDHVFGGRSRLASLIHEISRKENRTTEEVSRDWFEDYLKITLDPLLWLYETYGIALEAHQQNSVVQLRNGYPKTFYYRDNQGYYYSESKAYLLEEQLPDLNRKSLTICSDEVAEERFRYYFFMNHLFGLINGFGSASLIEESELLKVLTTQLIKHYTSTNGKSKLIKSLLDSEVLPCKANLLTRFHDMDELVGSLESQSVYTKVPNPLKEVLIDDAARI